jgi:hypothetical protein
MIQVAKEKLEKKKQEKAKKLADYEEGKKKRRAAAKRRAGDDWDSDTYEDDTKPPVFSDDEAEVQAPKPVAKKEPVEGEAQAEGQAEEAADTRDDFEKEFDRLNKLYEQDRAEEPDTFQVLEIKTKINQFKKEHPDEKIPADLLNEAFRWRLNQNDCQNRGYVLDGYPISYEAA